MEAPERVGQRADSGYGDGLTQALSSSSAPCSSASSAASLDQPLGTGPLFLLVLGFVGVPRRRASPCTTSTRPRWRATRRASRGHGAVGSRTSMPVAYESRSPITSRGTRCSSRRSSIVVGGLLRGVDGAVSAAIGLALVALELPRLGRGSSPGPPQRSPGAAAGRGARRLHRPARRCSSRIVLALEQSRFIDFPVLVLTIAVTHLGLLIWETRYVSLSLAAPGLKPGVGRA